MKTDWRWHIVRARPFSGDGSREAAVEFPELRKFPLMEYVTNTDWLRSQVESKLLTWKGD